jgi:AcrR family transcriptional regulator
MSRRTFYEHFADLTDALVQLYDAAADVLLRAIDDASRNEPDPRERLDRALGAYVVTIAANADLARIVYGEIRAAGPAHALRHQATVARFAALLRDWAVAARTAGLLKRLPDELTLHAATYGIEGAAMRYIYAGEEHRLARAGPRLAKFVLSALG